jgi:hypothetical protein
MDSGHGPDGHGHGPSDANGIGFDLGGIGFHGFSDGHGHHGGDVSIEALIVAHEFNHSGHTCGPATMSFDAVGGFHAGVDATLGGNVDFSGAPQDQRSFTFVVRNHGAVDLPSVISKETTKLGLIERPEEQGTENKISFRREHIAPVMIAGKPRLPKSSKEGDKGSTVYLRKPYSLGERSYVDNWLGNPAKFGKRMPNTRVSVSVAQWYFAEFGDYQTLITVTVQTPGIAAGYSTPADLGVNIKAARSLSSNLLKALQACPPSDRAKEKRAKKA